MVFSDPAFLFAFLPISLALILLLSGKAHSLSILALSLVFYYWTSGALTVLLAASIFGNWLLGRQLQDMPEGRWRDWSLRAGVCANLAVLAYFKYAWFIAGNIDALLGWDASGLFATIILPIGISFFTFQGISYLIDIRRGDVEAEPSLIRFGAYLSFFPQLIAGPIVRYRDVRDDFRAPQISLDNLAGGASRFVHGLLKKVLIADTAGRFADACFNAPAEISFAAAWLGALAFTIQIYFDFSGYSDMAIGIGRMCGIRIRENFCRPYSSATLTEFWRRWHISLSGWFRDYLYIPLGGNRAGTIRTYRNLAIVFLLTGAWHGAAWTFILWGLFHGAFLIIERLAVGARAGDVHAIWLRFVYLLPVVIIGWVLFRADSVADAGHVLLAMVSLTDPAAWHLPEALHALATPLNLIALTLGGLVFVMPKDVSGGVWAAQTGRTGVEAWRLSYLLVAVSVVTVLVLATDFSPFLYFQF